MTDKTPDQLTANMLRKEFYVVTTTPTRSPEIAKLLPEHLDYQVRLEREGKLFGAGPFYEEGDDVPSGGMIILRAQSAAEAREIADADPFHKAGLRTYTLRKWMMNEGAITLTIRYSDQSVVIAD
ncbi:YciI family protein [Hoeflea alexandrii]|uniref:YciI family protein n=1 Tax=Hoeflea alexandrii TaxID=288436 RepID=UPI00226F15B3|nr:YciI family protein [Hoeflea alexandrii]MCY0152060.1 YciI family protein [Hoeflea alexandrii]